MKLVRAIYRIDWIGILGFTAISLIAFTSHEVWSQTMPQQQNCTTTTSGSISHTHCGPPVVIQVQAPAVTVTPQITVQPAPVVKPTPPAPKPPEKPIKE